MLKKFINLVRPLVKEVSTGISLWELLLHLILALVCALLVDAIK
jgi:hypothetical protein